MVSKSEFNRVIFEEYSDAYEYANRVADLESAGKKIVKTFCSANKTMIISYKKEVEA